MTKVFKKLLASALALVMLIGVVPFAALAGDGNRKTQTGDTSAFRRIVHIDCGRKYFTVEEIKTVIGYADEYNYTHVELALGNDGLRFLLDDMSLEANGNIYSSDDVTNAVKSGNASYNSSANYSPSTSELTEDEMNEIIAYAKEKNIGIIPMFNAPGHLYAVTEAMKALGFSMTKGTDYIEPSVSGSSYNRALLMSNADGLDFVYALQVKYMEYFASKGCMFYNIAADESGFYKSQNGNYTMTTEEYTTYVELVNSLASAAKKLGLMPMMFNDGVYNPHLTSNTKLDTDITVCYWDAGGGTNYIQADELVAKGFDIINTHNKWYYVPSAQDTAWYGYTWAINNMKGIGNDADDCKIIDGDDDGSALPIGCMAAIWLDNPSASVDMSRVKNYMKTLATNGTNDETFAEERGVLWNETSDGDELCISANGVDIVDDKFTLEKDDKAVLSVGKNATWTVENENVVMLDSADDDVVNAAMLNVRAKKVNVEAVGQGTTTITAETDTGTKSLSVTVSDGGNVKVSLNVGDTESYTQENVGNDDNLTNFDKYIATAKVEKVTTGGDTKYTLVTELSAGEYYISNKSNDTSPKCKITLEGSGSSYYIKNSNGTYVYPNAEWGTFSWSSYTLGTGKNTVNITKSGSGYTFGKEIEHKGIFDNYTTTSYLSVSNGTLGAKQTATTLYLYKEEITDGSENASVTFTGTGEGSYTAVLGNVTYEVTVKAPTTTQTVTLNYDGSFTPEGVDITVESGNAVSLKDGKIVAGKTAGEAKVISAVKNAGGKVTAHYVYNVKVIAVDLSAVEALPLQLWITNNTVQADGTSATKTSNGWGGDSSIGGYANYTTVEAEKAYGENGISLEEAVAPWADISRKEYGGTRFTEENYKSTWTDKPSQNLVVWRGMIHKRSDSNIQTVWGTDYSNSGTAFNYVRYWSGAWQVSSDREVWVTVTGSGSTGKYGSCTEQLAVYYMIRTSVTNEITTDVSDWGKTYGGSEYTSQVNGNFVLLDFAVKYESGDRTPESFPVTDKTLAYHCDSNSDPVKTDSRGNYYRQLNNIRAMDTFEYELYMVTVTMTSDNVSTVLKSSQAKNGYTYDGEEKIVWAIDEEVHANCGLSDYTAISGANSEYSGCTVGGEADIRGVEIYRSHGALITYYVRVKQAENDLTVHYISKTTGNNEFYSYGIHVVDNTVFKENIALPDTDKKLGDLVNGDVTNTLGVKLVVTSDLTKMSAVPAQYRYATSIECVELVRSDDGTELFLYYEIKSDATFIVDFGLPLVIKPTDINEQLEGKVDLAKVTGISKYADITVGDDNSVTYKLRKFMNSGEGISITYTGQSVNGDGETSVQYSVRLLPASTVYYEDSFVTTSDGKGSAAGAVWTTDGTTIEAEQALSKLGDKALYGYDTAYDSCGTFSMGSAEKVTVAADMNANWNDETSAWPTATFTFRGTGFDVISITDNDSGAIIYTVENADKSYSKSYFVNNYYGYKYEDGEWVKVESGEENAIYQIPVIRLDGLVYDTYTVTLTAFYSEYFDKTGDSEYSFWLDAVRIYNPLGENYEEYIKDGEGYPQIIELHDEIVNKNADGMYTIEGKSDAVFAEYKNIGPNHEVYLAPGQSLAFTLDGDASKAAKVSIGLKALDGEVKYSVSGKAQGSIATATDLYYDITEYAKNGDNFAESITVTNTSDMALLSLTYVKITYTEKPEFEVHMSAIESRAEQVKALAMVRSAFAIHEMSSFVPEYFEASWSRNVKEGKRATLTIKTSEDVAYVKVGTEVVTNYKTRYRVEKGENGLTVVKYREFTYTTTATETTEYAVYAADENGVSSDAVIATLTVESGMTLDGLLQIFKKWF